MVLLAPRISPKLIAALARVDDERVPIAGTWRRVGAAADRLGLPRPSYNRIRVLVHELRRRRRRSEPVDVVLAVGVRMRPPRLRVARTVRRRSARGP